LYSVAQPSNAGANTSVLRVGLLAAQERPETRFWYEPLLESGLLPDYVIPAAIRHMLRDRL
jgi:hypothetical protein